MAPRTQASTETVVEQTAQAIRRAIRDGQFAPGQRLVVADIARLFGVSAGPAREAISRLTGEGLVENILHRGAVVRTFGPDEIRDIFQMREVVEGLLARLAATRVARDADAADRIRDSMIELRSLVEGAGDYVGHNSRFHALIYELAGNARAREIAHGLTLPIYRLRYHRLIDRTYVSTAAREHEMIASALLMGDGDLAEAAMRAHIRNSAEALATAVERRDGPGIRTETV